MEFEDTVNVHEEEESSEDEVQGTREEDSSAQGVNWLYLIKEVADITHESFSTVWMMNIYEFFNYVAFSRDVAERERRRVEQYKRTHGIRR